MRSWIPFQQWILSAKRKFSIAQTISNLYKLWKPTIQLSIWSNFLRECRCWSTDPVVWVTVYRKPIQRVAPNTPDTPGWSDVSSRGSKKSTRCPPSLSFACARLDQWIGLRENLNRKPWFLPSNIGLKPVNFPIIQFYDWSISHPRTKISAFDFKASNSSDPKSTWTALWGHPMCSWKRVQWTTTKPKNVRRLSIWLCLKIGYTIPTHGFSMFFKLVLFLPTKLVQYQLAHLHFWGFFARRVKSPRGL